MCLGFRDCGFRVFRPGPLWFCREGLAGRFTGLAIMESKMDKNMETEMETGGFHADFAGSWGLFGVIAPLECSSKRGHVKWLGILLCFGGSTVPGNDLTIRVIIPIVP